MEAAFYKLSDPVKQIESMVYNVVLGHVPKMKLDDTFLNQADIASDLRDNLDASMKEYGYSIVKVLISDIVPDQKVKAAMNDINAAQREREATVSRAETNKMLLVKQAEAEAESKRLQGEGIAQSEEGDHRGLERFGRGFRENSSGLHSAGRDATRSDDAVFRHAEGNCGERSHQHDFDSAHAQHAHRSLRPDSECDYCGKRDVQSCLDSASHVVSAAKIKAHLPMRLLSSPCDSACARTIIAGRVHTAFCGRFAGSL